MPFHFVGLKCGDCSGYNTRLIHHNNMPSYDRIMEEQERMRAAGQLNEESDSESDEHESDEHESDESMPIVELD